MVLTFALTVVLSQSAPDDQMSGHVITNIRKALRSSTSSAVVTVRDSDENHVTFDVNEGVLGEFPAELNVTARAFSKRDVAPGTTLLVFFRGTGSERVPTGQYELAADGKIREYPIQTYLTRTRFESKRLVKTKAAPAVIASAPGRRAGT